MATEYCRSMLRICIAQLCQNLGWSATQSSPLELLTDVLERYLMDLGKISHRYSEQFGRTEPNLDDLALTFRQYGIQLGELEDYIRHVEPVEFAHEVVSFPARKRNNLRFPNARSRELLQHREEHVDDHLPYMYQGMEDEVEEEPPRPTLPTPQLPQESVSPMAVSPTPSDKRPLSNSMEGPSAKRPRLTSTNLPEEAGHSQYEMKSVLMNPSGVLTPTRQGKLPDARTPPTFRQALQFEKDTPKGRENKEGVLPSHPPEDYQNDKSNSCVAPKKKMLKQYKQMAADTAALGVARSPTVGKIGRSPKPGSPLVTKSAKAKPKGKSKENSDKREDATGESCLKNLLLTPKQEKNKGEKGLVSKGVSPKPKHKCKKVKGEFSDKVPRPEPEAQVRGPGSQGLPTKMAPGVAASLVEENSRDDSPERLVIAESDAKVKLSKEERQAWLDRVEETLDSVVRDSVAEMELKDSSSRPEDVQMKMFPKPTKGKKKVKSSDKLKKKDKKNLKSLDETVDSVVRQSSGESLSVGRMDGLLSALPVATELPLEFLQDSVKKEVKDKKDKKKGGKKKDKGGSTKDKLKDKLKYKEKVTDMDKKPSILDKFSGKEFSVYDFPESPPSFHVEPKKSTPKSGTSPRQAPPTPIPTPLQAPAPAPPVPTPQVPMASSPVVSVESDDSHPIIAKFAPLLPLKLDLKHKEKKDKERSKDKEHKKEKKEKKKDKEKKKKNKDKEKEKSRDKSKSRDDRHKEDSTGGSGIVAPIKLNIKFGGVSATSTVVTEPKMTPPKPEVLPSSPLTPRSESQPWLSPKREIPKLVIKPIRRESLEAKAKLGAAVRSPAVASPPKSPPHQHFPQQSLTAKVKTPPKSPPPKVKTPPVSPPPKIKTPPRSPSIPPPSPPKLDSPPPKYRTPSPPPSPSLSPPPRTPTPPSSRSPSPPPRFPTPEKRIAPSPEPTPRSPSVSPVRKSPTPEPESPPPRKSPIQVKKSPRPTDRSPTPRPASPPVPPSPKSTPPSSPGSPRLEMDIENADGKPKSRPEPKSKAKQSPKANKASPKGKRGRKPKEEKEKEQEEVKGGAVKARTKSVPSVTSETVSETPITGPIVQRTVVAETVGSFIDAEGNKVWICPSCKMQDDGSAMIGCDNCDDWYHWACMDITQEPDEDEWYCPRCKDLKIKSKSQKGKPKGKKRGRKKKTI